MDRMQITAFEDDMAVIPEHVPGEAVLPDFMNAQHTDSMTHNIISFLERPQLISVFAWKNMSIDKHGQNILAFMDPSDRSRTLVNPLVPSQVMTNMFIEKLQGFTSFRATAVFRLQLNSQPFQAGRLIFGAVPMPTLLEERAGFIMRTPCSAISVNHVQIDINKQTEVELRVPFISPFNSYDLINQQYDWARLFCIVYAPLNVVGSDNQLDIGLWCHFEDIELGCPTSAMCTIKPCWNPTRVTYWGDADPNQMFYTTSHIPLDSFPISQGGTVHSENDRAEARSKWLKKIELRRQQKKKDMEMAIERVAKNIAHSQSGEVPKRATESFQNLDFNPNKVICKGEYFGFAEYGPDQGGKKYTLNIPPGLYWVDIYSVDNDADGLTLDTWKMYWSTERLCFSGPMNLTQDMLTYTVEVYNKGVAVNIYFFQATVISEDINVRLDDQPTHVIVDNKITLEDNPLDVNVVNDVLKTFLTNTDPVHVLVDNDDQHAVPVSNSSSSPTRVIFDQPIWITDHDQDPVSPPPSPPPDNDNGIDEKVELPPPPRKISILRRFPRSQSGRFATRSHNKVSVSKNSIPNKPKSVRVPPKEPPPAKIKEQRVEESDGAFAKSVKKFAGTVSSVVTGIGGAVAQVGNWLGWSKPQIGHSGETIVIRPCQYFGNTNGIDHSHVLSLDLLNNVDAYPNLTGTDLDELSFEFIKRVPQFIGAFQYNQKNIITSNVNTGIGDDYLWSCFVTPNYLNPACFKYQYSGTFGDTEVAASNILSIQNPTSLAYAISPFTYWTGSIVYTFRFAKTDFNSGRIEISYHPFLYSNKINNKNTPVPDNQRFEYAYKLVVDLRENSEVSFTVPYISPQPWKALSYYAEKYFIDPWTNPDGWSDLAENELSRCSTGLLWVRALTPLHTQSAVAPTSILCLVEARAGDDFAVQCPAASRYMPMATSQAGRVYAVPGTQDTRTRALEGFQPPSITGNDDDTEREDTQIYCAGELFDNFRSFLRRNMFVRLLSQYRPDQSAILYPVEYIKPSAFTINIYQNKYDKQYYQIFKMANWPSPLSFTASMYCFYRGGIRFKLVPTTASGGILSMRLVQQLYDGVPTIIRRENNGTNTYQTFCSAVQYEQNDKRICEFQVPYYSPTIQSCHWSTQGGYLFDNPLPCVEVGDSNVTSSVKSASFFSISVSASDDFDLGLFLGAPLCMTSRMYHDGFEYNRAEGDIQEADWFENGNAYNNIHKADPCHGTSPFGGGTPPSDFTKISTTDLNVTLKNFKISNPDLTTTSDPGKVFILGC